MWTLHTALRLSAERGRCGEDAMSNHNVREVTKISCFLALLQNVLQVILVKLRLFLRLIMSIIAVFKCVEN